MQIIPLQAIPNQTLQVQLGGQNCTIAIQQTSYAMFFSLTLGSNSSPTVAGINCENLNRLVRDAYLGFSGDLVFNDTQGTSDPVYTGLGGLGARFQLAYLTPDDLTALGLSS